MRRTAAFFLLTGLLLSGCASAIQVPPIDRKTPLPHGLFATPAGIEPTVAAEFAPAALAARADLAALLDIAPEKIAILDIEPGQWPDSCLGLGGPAESCLQQITDGYQILMQAIGAIFTYRTNLDGSVVRNEYPQVADAQAPAQIARVVLAGQLGLSDPTPVQLVQALPVVWLDSCLGAASSGTACAEVLTPGFRILLEAQGMRYEFHSNQDGTQVVQVELS